MGKYSLSILIVFGSGNGEEKISHITANNVFNALLNSGYKNIQMYDLNSAKVCAYDGNLSLKNENSSDSIQKNLNEVQALDFNIVSYIKKSKTDVVFNATHGSFGEDGKLQQILDLLGTKYTHSGPLASMIGMDKYRFYELLSPHGIDFPEYELVDISKIEQGVFKRKIEDFIKKFKKIIIKPNNGGSSVGLMVVDENCVNESVLNYYSDDNQFKELLICRYIDGIEVSCGMLCDKILDCVEIIPGGGVYNYDAKYLTFDRNQYLIPPKSITKEQQFIIKNLTKKMHDIIGCKTISRSDFIVCKETGKVYTLEINTQPGMTPSSLTPKMAKHTLNMSYEDLIEDILIDAIDK